MNLLPAGRPNGFAVRFAPRSGAGGFTLVEILTALLVLMIGLAGVIGLLYGSLRESHVASDRNAAGILIPEAVRNIEQAHRITQAFRDTYPTDIRQEDVGGLIETLDYTTGAGIPGVSDRYPFYSALPFSTPGPLAMYPTGPAAQVGGSSYRIRYRLEMNPEWRPLAGTDTPGMVLVENSSGAGLYLLTLVCYRILQQNDTQVMVPVSDPVAVYLRDRRIP